MRYAACALALLLGWWAGAGLNRLAAWLETRRAGDVAGTLAVGAQDRGRTQASPLGAGPSWPRRLGLPATSAGATLALWLRYGLDPAMAPAAAMVFLLLLIAAIDVDCRLVFDEVLLAGVALALAHAALRGPAGLGSALAGGALAFILFLLLGVLGRGALGGGDIKLAGVLGLALGYPAVLHALMLGVFIGGVTAAVLLLARRARRHTAIPYAPFLAAGGILALLIV